MADKMQEALLETIATISNLATSMLEIDNLLQAIVNLIRDHLDFYFVGIFLVDKTSEWAELRATANSVDYNTLPNMPRLKIDNASTVGYTICYGQPSLTPTSEATQVLSTIHLDNQELPNSHSEIVLPLNRRGQMIGALVIQSIKITFSQNNIRSIQTLAAVVSTVIENNLLVSQVGKNHHLTEIEETKHLQMETAAEVIHAASSIFDESQLFMKTVIDQIPDPIFIKDRNQKWIIANKAFAEGLLGLSAEKIIGQTGYDYLLKEEADWLQAQDAQVFATGEIQEAEGPLTDATGTIHTIYARKVPLVVANKIEYVIGIINDITERKQTEEQLHKLSLAVEQSPSLVIITNTQGEIEYVNPKFTEITGYTAEEVIGKNPRILKSGVKSTTDYNHLWQTIAEGREWHGEFQNVKKNGEFYWTSAFISSIKNMAGDITHFLAVQENITEYKRAEEGRRQAEAKYHSIFENAIEGIFQTTKDGYYISANPALARIYGYESPQQLIERLTDIAGQLYVEPNRRDEFIKLMRAGGKVVEFESQIYRKDGSVIWISENAHAVYDEEGMIAHYEGTVEDITQRKQTEEQLRKLSRAVEQSPNIVVITDMSGKIEYVNPKFTEITGYTAAEIIGQNPRLLKSDKTSREAYQQLWQTITSGNEWRGEFHNRKKNGEFFWSSVSISPIKNSEGAITHFLAVEEDITAQKLAAEALRENERRYRTIFEQSRDMIFITTCAGEFLTVNQSGLDLFGYTKNEMIGMDVRNIYVDPAGRAKFQQEIEQKGFVRDYEVKFQKKNGEEMDCLLTATVWQSHDGSIEGYQGTIRNITQRKRAEEAYMRLATALDAVGESILITDVHGIIQYVNPAFERITGYKQEEAIGQNPRILKSDKHDPQFYKKIWETLARGEVWRNAIVNKRKDGGLFDVEETLAPIRDSSGKIINYVAVARDITDRKRAELALQKAFERTQSLYRINSALATTKNQQTTFETILGEYLNLLNLNRGGFMLLNETNEYHQLQAWYLDGQAVAPNLIFPAAADLVAQHLFKNPAPLVIEDVPSHPLTKDNQERRGQVEAMLLIPVLMRDKVVGIIGADATEKGHVFSQSDIEIGQTIADQLTVWLENRHLLEEARYRSDRLQTAAEVSRAASSILDMDALIDTSVNLIRDQFNFYYVGLFMVDDDREWAVLQAGTGEAGRIQLEKKHRLKIGGESMIGWCVQNRKARIALDVGEEAVRFQNPYLPETHSEMALPLISRDKVIGAITVQSVERSAFSNEDITLLQTMADQLSNAIENARLFESVAQAQKEAEHRLQEIQALQQLSQALAKTLEAQEILNIFFHACTGEIGFEYVLVSLVDKYQHRVKAISGVGITESHIKKANCFLSSKDIMVDVVQTGRTEIIAGWDDRFNKEIFETEGHATWVRVFTPITLRQENIGLVEAGFNKNVNVNIKDSQIRLLRAFIDQMALALDNAQRYEASQRAARRETLIKEITTKVRASTDLDTILQTTVKEVGDAIGSKRVYVHLTSSANNDEAKDKV